MDIKDLVHDAYENAKAKGFHSEPKSFGDDIALIHSEVSEALEAFRMVGVDGVHCNMPRTPKGKPEGVPSELADIVIRVADVCGKYGIDLDEAVVEKLAYNATREYRHGGKHL